MSQTRFRRTAALSFLAAGALVPPLLIAGSASAGSAVVTNSHEVRKGDFVAAYSDTRANGYYGFGPKGLVLRTDGTADVGTDGKNSDKVAEYFTPASSAMPGSGSYIWSGSVGQPGSQIVFHRAGQTAASDYNVLVGEQANSSNAAGQPVTDFWYTGGSAKAAKKSITCPSTSGGSGSDCHGTLAQWQTAVPGAGVDVIGFSLGSGVQGDGVLKSITFDSDVYTFVDAPAASVVSPPTSPAVAPSVTIHPSKSSIRKGRYVTFNGGVSPYKAGTTVSLQRYYHRAWHTLKNRALRSSGTYHFAYKATSKGNKYFRAVVAATTNNLKGTSRTVKVHVR